MQGPTAFTSRAPRASDRTAWWRASVRPISPGSRYRPADSFRPHQRRTAARRRRRPCARFRLARGARVRRLRVPLLRPRRHAARGAAGRSHHSRVPALPGCLEAPARTRARPRSRGRRDPGRLLGDARLALRRPGPARRPAPVGASAPAPPRPRPLRGRPPRPSRGRARGTRLPRGGPGRNSHDADALPRRRTAPGRPGRGAPGATTRRLRPTTGGARLPRAPAGAGPRPSGAGGAPASSPARPAPRAVRRRARSAGRRPSGGRLVVRRGGPSIRPGDGGRRGGEVGRRLPQFLVRRYPANSPRNPRFLAAGKRISPPSVTRRPRKSRQTVERSPIKLVASSTVETAAWYTNDAFWQAFEPIAFGRDRWDRGVAEVPAIERLLGVKPGGRVADFCCGPGRHLLELARRGYRVTGVDRTHAYLERAAAVASDEGLDVQLIEADILAFSRE